MINFGKQKCLFFFSETKRNEEKRVKLQRNCGIDRKKADGVCFKCFYPHKVEFQIICQEEVSLVQWCGSEKQNNENLGF